MAGFGTIFLDLFLMGAANVAHDINTINRQHKANQRMAATLSQQTTSSRNNESQLAPTPLETLETLVNKSVKTRADRLQMDNLIETIHSSWHVTQS